MIAKHGYYCYLLFTFQTFIIGIGNLQMRHKICAGTVLNFFPFTMLYEIFLLDWWVLYPLSI